MNAPERWSRVQEICDTALSLELSGRPTFLTTACAGDAALRHDVESLLAQAPKSDGFLTTSALERAAHAVVTEASGSLVGHHLGPYELTALIGVGGMGEVYRARDQRLNREVAVKVLPAAFSADPERLRRFEQEARAAAALNHSNILALYDIGHHDGVPYIVSELLEGETLSEHLKRAPLSTMEALDVAVQLAQALAVAHDAGIVHRDVKPGNIFITNRQQVKVLDFGLAKAFDSQPVKVNPSDVTDDSLTAAGVGTIAYMSPEQTAGERVDQRSDVWSLGVVLYEMLAGQRPFRGDQPRAVAVAIASATPDALHTLRADVPQALDRVVQRALAKRPGDRYATAGDLISALQEVRRILIEPRGLSRSGRQRAIAAAGLSVVLALVALVWLWHRSVRERWARDVATPEISGLLDAGEFAKAAALARDARTVLPMDPTLASLWQRATQEESIDSVPTGADVSIRPYRADPDAWQSLGRTPLKNLRLPKDEYVWRLAKPGFSAAFVITGYVPAPQPGLRVPVAQTLHLRPESAVPPDMLVVQGGSTSLGFPYGQVRAIKVNDYLIDQHEVTNEAFQKFVDAGGYRRREFWTEPFVKDAREIPWAEAIDLFRDATGRLGPSTWKEGRYPAGMEAHPVAGVSWYEAAAYARFVGKSLPTVYHWTLASQSSRVPALIADGSNFRAVGTQSVGGRGTLSGFGTTDMAGNVKEWCRNEGRGGKRFILGGGFGDPLYMFSFTDEQQPWDRRANFGVRCVKLDAPLTAAESARIEITSRDYNAEKPVSDDVFKAYSELYAYDHGELHARTDETETTDDWTRERVSFDAAYGNERVTAQLFLPSRVSPPYQVVVYFPGGYAFVDEKLDLPLFEGSMDFLMKSGRALIVPTYKGTYERRESVKPGDQAPALGQPPALFRDDMIMWSKDLGRTLDYLETRHDIDSQKIAYLGFSHGGQIAPTMLAIDKRFKAAIFSSGGLMLRRDLPEVDRLNFVTHVRVPVLMLNGRYDSAFPLESSQLPLFRLLGTPDKDKKHVIYDRGHGDLPHPQEVRESLDWLDKYLGSVRR